MREEHTERLKQGFIKVVQKEKEFERQLQNQQREEQLMQQKLAEQQRQQQQQIMEVLGFKLPFFSSLRFSVLPLLLQLILVVLDQKTSEMVPNME